MKQKKLVINISDYREQRREIWQIQSKKATLKSINKIKTIIIRGKNKENKNSELLNILYGISTIQTKIANNKKINDIQEKMQTVAKMLKSKDKTKSFKEWVKMWLFMYKGTSIRIISNIS